ncbi:[acyl-carrier-protein] S-malonyltransferase [Legionella qingyii]|uniref:Malonyl CoA-acyl carrier protein transacylase n=1 Tax=Legionella qingyii TaxID=2184757 RepID=A0A317U6P5_9GAMM|nr:ACP S-malonyltransferase [Legionella qingyii]PWY57654.1 [acyl-carrier-protein] S-malonyltransferase [Legionella qingyii]RUR25879.1 [acyl-carrier-protein] S-malonyltransferase [Legionella qingyii]
MSVLLFPGQGSQYKGMGKELFKLFPDLVAEANQLLGYDIERAVFGEEMNQTQYTQPLIYCVSIMDWLERKAHLKVDMVLGHSLGEYAALYAAGVFDFATGLNIVKRRAELMSEAKEGAMAAILGINAAKIEAIIEENRLPLVIANYNSPMQTVISGTKESIAASSQLFTEGRFIPLKVSGAFHSPLMHTAAETFYSYLKQFQLHQPRYPILLNATARAHVDCLTAMPKLLSQQLVSPVFWHQSIEYCLALGYLDFVELGPGQVLTSLLDAILDDPVITRTVN